VLVPSFFLSFLSALSRLDGRKALSAGVGHRPPVVLRQLLTTAVGVLLIPFSLDPPAFSSGSRRFLIANCSASGVVRMTRLDHLFRAIVTLGSAGATPFFVFFLDKLAVQAGRVSQLRVFRSFSGSFSFIPFPRKFPFFCSPPFLGRLEEFGLPTGPFFTSFSPLLPNGTRGSPRRHFFFSPFLRNLSLPFF